MNDERSERLAVLLRETPIPISSSARRQAAATAAGEVIVDRAHPRRRTLAATLALLAITFVALTPPGRALAEWAAELVGVGEVGGPPTLHERPGRYAPSIQPIVFATGTAPNGKPFEMVAYETRGIRPPRESISTDKLNPATCLSVEFPEGPGSLDGGDGWCYSGSPTEQGIHVYSYGFGEEDSDGNSIVTMQGEANADTRSVEVTYTDLRSGERWKVPATVAVLDGELGRRINVKTPTAAFIAFVPGVDHVSAAWAAEYKTEAVAYDENGTEIARDTNAFPGRQASALVRDALTLSRKAVEEDCAGLDLEAVPRQQLPPDCRRALELAEEFPPFTEQAPPPVFRGPYAP